MKVSKAFLTTIIALPMIFIAVSPVRAKQTAAPAVNEYGKQGEAKEIRQQIQLLRIQEKQLQDQLQPLQAQMKPLNDHIKNLQAQIRPLREQVSGFLL